MLSFSSDVFECSQQLRRSSRTESEVDPRTQHLVMLAMALLHSEPQRLIALLVSRCRRSGVSDSEIEEVYEHVHRCDPKMATLSVLQTVLGKQAVAGTPLSERDKTCIELAICIDAYGSSQLVLAAVIRKARTVGITNEQFGRIAGLVVSMGIDRLEAATAIALSLASKNPVDSSDSGMPQFSEGMDHCCPSKSTTRTTAGHTDSSAVAACCS